MNEGYDTTTTLDRFGQVNQPPHIKVIRSNEGPLVKKFLLSEKCAGTTGRPYGNLVGVNKKNRLDRAGEENQPPHLKVFLAV